MGKALSGELSCPCDRSCWISIIWFMDIHLFVLMYGYPKQESWDISKLYLGIPINKTSLVYTKVPVITCHVCMMMFFPPVKHNCFASEEGIMTLCSRPCFISARTVTVVCG